MSAGSVAAGVCATTEPAMHLPAAIAAAAHVPATATATAETATVAFSEGGGRQRESRCNRRDCQREVIDSLVHDRSAPPAASVPGRAAYLLTQLTSEA
jgi:hypothetical protein